jgi:hypothetical protein
MLLRRLKRRPSGYCPHPLLEVEQAIVVLDVTERDA